MTNQPLLNEHKFRTGSIIDSSLCYLLLEDPVLAEQDFPHTTVAIWQPGEEWISASLEYNGISIAVTSGKSGSRKVVIVGDTGKCTVIVGGKATTGTIIDEDALSSVNYIHGSVIAVGILGGIYRMRDPSSWDVLSHKSIDTNLESCCEHPDGGFLVCGWQGVVAMYDDGSPERLESGTNVILTSINCDSEGNILACGQKGTIVLGKKDSLNPLGLDGIADDFWSIVKFQGEIYVASVIALYKLVNDETLELVKFEGEAIPTSFYHLETYEDSLMLSVGEKDAVLFDGKDWTRIL